MVNDSTPLQRPDVKEYLNYRQFLADFYRFKKSVRRGFSFRRFADLAGIKSPNFLQLVMQGKRNMSEEMGKSVAKAMALNATERAYFLALIRKENAKSPEQVHEADRALLRSLKKLVSRDIPASQAPIALSQWYHLVIRELVFIQEFQADGQWIARKLRGLITPREAEEALAALRCAGLLRQDENGAFHVTEPVVDTGECTVGFPVSRIHQETLLAWQRIMPNLSQEEREFGLVNIPIHSSRIAELKERMRVFQEEIIGWLQDEQNADQVVQLGCYLIPITTPEDRQGTEIGSPSQQGVPLRN